MEKGEKEWVVVEMRRGRKRGVGGGRKEKGRRGRRRRKRGRWEKGEREMRSRKESGKTRRK